VPRREIASERFGPTLAQEEESDRNCAIGYFNVPAKGGDGPNPQGNGPFRFVAKANTGTQITQAISHNI
jgi:hypothetical protein